MNLTESIGSKIRWLIISFTLFVSLFFISLLVIYVWVVEDNIFNRMVKEEARYIEQQYRQIGEVVPPRIPFMSLYRGWQSLPEDISLLRQQSPNRIEFPLNDGGTLHLTELQLGNTTWLLAADVSPYEMTKVYLPKLVPWILLILFVMGLCAFVLARYLSKSVVTPLQHITFGVVNHNGIDPLQFQQPFANNEIGYLADTICNSFNRLNATLQRETDFSRDISHELRTPVAVLKMVSGRIQAQEPLDVHTVNRVKTAVCEIEQSLNVLLALSREESIETESLVLLQEIEHCIVNHFALSKEDDAKLTINIPPTYRIICNKNLLHMLLNNVLDNVINHASEVSLSIDLEEHQLTFSNPMEAMPQDNLLAPQVKSQSSKGLGQGLHLVKRICEQYGWAVEVGKINREFTLKITLVA